MCVCVHAYMCVMKYIHVAMFSHRRGGGHIVFGVDPVCVGFSVTLFGIGMTLSCLHTSVFSENTVSSF